MSTGILMGNTYGQYVVTANLTPAQVNTVTAPEQSFTSANAAIIGQLRLGDVVNAVVPPSEVAGVAVLYGRIPSAGTLNLKFVNPTAGNVTPAAGAYTLIITRPESQAADVAIGD